MKKTIPFKHYLKNQIYPLGLRLGFLLILYSFFRILFYIANANSFPDVKLIYFFHGIRFDVSAISYTNAPYMLAVILPFSFFYRKIYRKICDLYFILMNGFAAAVSYIDVAYYPYVLKRTTIDFFSYLKVAFDFQTLMPTFLKDFWYLLLIFLATLFVIIYLVKVTNKLISKNPVYSAFSWKELIYKILVFSLIFYLTVIGQRGTQLRPLGLMDTAKYASIQNAPLLSNTPFTMVTSVGKIQYEPKCYFKDLDEAEQIYSPIIKNIIPLTENNHPVKNVVFIFLESFSPYLIDSIKTDNGNKQLFCPFLYDLKQKSISFNGIANGKKTIEAMPAVFGGIPVLFDQSYVLSVFATNYTYSPVEVLKKRGFNTLFFHGAKNGSMRIDGYTYSIGFDAYYGKNEYPNPNDDDGVWGISDRPYLQYVAKVLNNARQPFLAAVITLSSHHPFVIPKDAKELDIKYGPQPIHATASYTDYAVRDFFETVRQYSWYDSTLFIIAADHTGPGAVPTPNSRYMEYQIPIFFYHPKANAGINYGMMQQLDMMPTLFSYLNINEPIFSYGNNVLDSSYTPLSVSYLSGIYQLTAPDYVLQFDGEKSIGLYDIRNDIMMKKNLLKVLPDKVTYYEQKMKAIIHSYTTRMVENKLFLKDKSVP